jgi:hypothetical protein
VADFREDEMVEHGMSYADHPPANGMDDTDDPPPGLLLRSSTHGQIVSGRPSH